MTTAVPLPTLHTSRYKNFEEEDILEDEYVIVASTGREQRSTLPVWERFSANHPDRCVRIIHESQQSVGIDGAFGRQALSLRDADALQSLVKGKRILLDISGMAHSTWAAIIKAIYVSRASARILYAEPNEYKSHPSPVSDSVFDLSEGFAGVAPLPGFSTLAAPERDEDALFVTLLGFEGSRPGRLFLTVDPSPLVVPVIGVPGFKMEYPTYSVACNRQFLSRYGGNGEIRFARASCPFEAFRALELIQQDFPGQFMYIAPVGTKPHSVGAVCFALKNPGTTEILYDHPIRRSGRSSGVGIIHVYNFGCFDPFRP